MTRSESSQVSACVFSLALFCTGFCTGLDAVVLDQGKAAFLQQRYLFDIPSQSLSNALKEFSRVTSIQVLVNPDVLIGKQVNTLKGRYSVSEVLEKLTDPFPIQVRVLESGIVVSALNNKADDLRTGSEEEFSSEPVLEHLIVTGVRASLARSLDIKRHEARFVDAIVAEDIVDFPDLNVGEALQRIAGITISRSFGEGRQVSLRGLPAEFSRVTINDSTAVSGNPGREFDFDIFPSELFGQVEVYKSPSADLTEGGLAGTINLRTLRPFDYSGFNFSLSAKAAQYDLISDTEPRLSFQVSNTFNDKWGALFSASYSDTSVRVDLAEGFSFSAIDADLDGDGTNEVSGVDIPLLPRALVEVSDRQRLGMVGSLQFLPSKRVNAVIDFVYSKVEQDRQRYSIDGFLFDNPIPISLDVEGNLAVAGVFDDVSQRTENVIDHQDSDFFLAHFKANWQITNRFNAGIKLNCSWAREESPLELRYVYEARGRFFYDLTGDSRIPAFGSPDFSVTDASVFNLDQIRFSAFENRDRECSGRADLEYSYRDYGLDSIALGIEYRERNKDRQRFRSRIGGGDNPPSLVPVAREFPFNNFLGGRGGSGVPDEFVVVDFDAAQAELVPDNFRPPQDFGDSFSIQERVLGGYIKAGFQGKWMSKRLRGDFGMRIVGTDQISRGFRVVNGVLSPIVDRQSYLDILPSVNLMLDLDTNLLLRMAASRAITRPTLTDISSSQRVSPTERLVTIGNPDLDPFRAFQTDLSLEWYFEENSLLALTLFYKDIESFITEVQSVEPLLDVGLIDDNGDDVSGEDFVVTRVINGEGATLTGLELAFQHPLSWLPAPFDGLGVQANYTYADSSATVRINGEALNERLPGQSPNSFNLVAYYETNQFSARIAHAWRDTFVSSIQSGRVRRQQQSGQLDFSLRYELNDQLSLTFEGLNLASENSYVFENTPDRSIRYSDIGRFFLLGIQLSI